MLRQLVYHAKPLLQRRTTTTYRYATQLRHLSTQNDESDSASPRLEPADEVAVEAFESALKEEGLIAEENVTKAVEDYAFLLEATREKMRLTVEWRGDAQSERDVIEATARRVGLDISDKSNN